MVGKEIERVLNYSNIEIGNATMSAGWVVVGNGKVKSISSGSGIVGDNTFTFEVYLNNAKQNQVMIKTASPYGIDAHELVGQFISFVETDIV